MKNGARGEALRRLIAKCVLSVAKGQAQELAALISSFVDCKQIESGFHAGEDWGFLLIGSPNAFNKIHRTDAIGDTHEWPSAAFLLQLLPTTMSNKLWLSLPASTFKFTLSQQLHF